MAIKMKIETKKDCVCQNCNTPWKYTKEMYTILLIDTKFTLCYDCMDEIFHKTLKAQCLYAEKLKKPEDQKRITAAMQYKNKGMKFVEPEERPGCYGMFKKRKECKKCEYLSECKTIWEDSQWEE